LLTETQHSHRGEGSLEPALAWILVLALVGAIVGSFLGLVSVRLPLGEPIALGRSRCPGCSRTLGPADLVPLLSYLLLRGRCRTCRAPISRRYPLIELACLLIGAGAACVYPDARGVAAALLGWWLLLLAVLDLEHYWLPDRLTYPLAAAGVGAAAWFGTPQVMDSLIGAASGYLSFAAIALAYRRVRGRHGLGGGDWKLFASAGAWLGWQGLPLVLLIAALLGLAAALILHWRKAEFLAQRLPFGAFLAPAIWLLYLLGPDVRGF
jgi:leader peptidase (prepilin peptidase)/N-methyltransferase